MTAQKNSKSRRFRLFARKKLSSHAVVDDEPHLLKAMLNNVGDELMLIRSNGSIAYVNDATVQGLGHARAVLLKKKVYTLFKEKMSLRRWREEYFLPLKRDRRPVRIQAQRVLKNKSVQTIDIFAVYLRHPSGEYILSAARDITDQLSLQRTLSERIEDEQKAREIDKMLAMRLFVSGTAQEIKFPLQAVLSQSRQLIQKYRNRDFEYIGFKEFTEIVDTLQTISNQVRYCCDVTNKLLTVGKKKAGLKAIAGDVNATIRRTVDLFSQQLTLGAIAPVLKLAKKLPYGAIAATDLDQIINNIMTNAVQSMPSGGRITVKTFYRRHNQRIYVEFKDEGVGIPKQNLSRIFEPFFTTKQTGPGQSVGLGLAVVYSLIKSCHGNLSVKSNLREGTTVRIELPVAKRTKSKKK